jgi:tRNA1Val (adenine37-N6)-methyltransferase
LATIFSFKQFQIEQEGASFKIGTDAMILGSLITFDKAKSALDIGSGTGVLSLMVAQKHPDLVIDAIDIDEVNCRLMEMNFKKSPFAKRLNVIEHDFISFHFRQKYDLIFTNPPYFLGSLENNELRQASSRHFTISTMRDFVKRISVCLEIGGLVYVILPAENFSLWENVFKENQMFLNEQIEIEGKPSQLIRIIAVFSTESKELTQDKLIIRNEKGLYSKEYIALTKDFHSIELSSD